jgi:hypothetical protein
MNNEFMKRGYLLPEGCKDLKDVLKLAKPQPASPAWALIADKQGVKTKAVQMPKPTPHSSPLAPWVIMLPEFTTAAQLARMIGTTSSAIVAAFRGAGLFVEKDQFLDFDTVAKVVRHYGLEPRQIIIIPEKLTVSALAAKLGQKPFRLVAEMLKMGIFKKASSQLNFEIVSKIVSRFGFLAQKAGK